MSPLSGEAHSGLEPWARDPERPGPDEARLTGAVGAGGIASHMDRPMSHAVSDRIAVQRALTELRSGRPVLILGPAPIIVISAEAADARGFAALARAAGSSGTERQSGLALVLSAERLRSLGLHDRVDPGWVDLEGMEAAHISNLASDPAARLFGVAHPTSMAERSAIELARLALLLPALVRATPLPEAVLADGILSVDGAAIDAYPSDRKADLMIVSRAQCPLDGAPDAEIVVFRAEEGFREQVAVVLGQPDLGGIVRVRLHSACLTGDLLGSLRCDCGDQLRGSVQSMIALGGGVLLYLDHEGRGIGLANKIRAYRLQSQGFDTFEADAILGFSRDHRSYAFAAEMLRLLGIQSISLLTNNPTKMFALEEAGVHVAEMRLAPARITEHNARYLAVKRNALGHWPQDQP